MSREKLKTQIIPYNICDRWCERCEFQRECLIFQSIFKIQMEHLAKRDDLSDPKIILAGLKKAFSKIINSIKKDFKKHGIDEKKITVKINPDANKAGSGLRPKRQRKLTLEDNSHTFLLISNKSSFWQLANSFSSGIHKLLEAIFSDEEFDENFTPSLGNVVEELNYYHLFSIIKLEEALEEGTRSLSLIAARLSLESFITCKKNLEKISDSCPGYIDWARNLSIKASKIIEQIETKFPYLDKVKIIFHGCK